MLHIKINGLIGYVMRSNMFSYVKLAEKFNGDIYFALTWPLAAPRRKSPTLFFKKMPVPNEFMFSQWRPTL